MKNIFWKTLMEIEVLGSWWKGLLINSLLPFACPSAGYCCCKYWLTTGNSPLPIFSEVLSRVSFHKGCLRYPPLNPPWFFIKPKSPFGLFFSCGSLPEVSLIYTQLLYCLLLWMLQHYLLDWPQFFRCFQSPRKDIRTSKA